MPPVEHRKTGNSSFCLMDCGGCGLSLNALHISCQALTTSCHHIVSDQFQMAFDLINFKLGHQLRYI